MYIGRLMCKDSFAINPPLLLEYYEAKIQMLSMLSWKLALKNATLRQNSNFLTFKSALFEVKLLANCGEKFDKFN